MFNFYSLIKRTYTSSANPSFEAVSCFPFITLKESNDLRETKQGKLSVPAEFYKRKPREIDSSAYTA